jgi:uncharacterized protein (DUF2141 family)
MIYKILILLIVPFIGLSQHNISISVSEVSSADGNIMVAVYKDSESFLAFEKVYKTGSAQANKGITEVHLADIPEGEYAIAIFHDENGNNELDTNWIGIPKEDVGFSYGKMKTFGPPRFKECAFTLDSHKHISISL